jgi:predicted TIM-barrel fold metal-dependent hydrolase
MSKKLNRRTILASAMAAPWLVSPAMLTAEENSRDKPTMPAPRMDVHVHLFGKGDNNSGCRMSKDITESANFQLLVKLLRVEKRAKTLDEGYVLALAEQVEQSGLTKALIYAQDGVYDRTGKPDWERTPVYVPNDYLLKIVARYPKTMMPCVSINPDRRDCITELEHCVEKGARVLKIHPPIQGVDIADKKHTKFFQRCAALKVTVMVHTGHEHASPIFDSGLANPRKMELGLEQGCRMVACHCGTGRPSDKPDMLPDFLAMIRKHKNLYGDTAVLGGLGRSKDFLRLLDDKLAPERLLHGSDFPFPPAPIAFAEKIGMAEALRLQAMGNLLKQDYELKEALGIGRASAERAYHFFVDRPA